MRATFVVMLSLMSVLAMWNLIEGRYIWVAIDVVLGSYYAYRLAKP